MKSSTASRSRAAGRVHAEHTTLRRLVSAIASALDQADDRRCLELVGKLRSVLLLHLAKEARLARELTPAVPPPAPRPS